MTTFSDFNLNPALLKSLESEGYITPTPIQAQAIPVVLAGRDLLGIAQTGTGKTAAFALPILHRLAATRRDPQPRGCRVLVLSPTRELTSQICDSFRVYGRHLGVKVAAVFGGVAHRPQREAMARGLDILVATPGRLLDHMEERNVTLDGVEMLVLDEADQMLDMGFVQPIRRIIARLPARRQCLFFSATMPKEIGRLAGELLKDPAKVSVTPAATTVERVRQQVYLVDAKAKRGLLVELFANPELTRSIVFTRTKRGADKVARYLEAAGINCAAIHGNKSQNQRQAALAAFKASRIRALVATDVAARGIDIDLVTHVVNYELPNVPESYVHRIGRTARAGAEGVAISLCDAEERAYLRDIERLTRQSIPAEDRRNDASLAVTPEPARGEARPHGDRRHDRPQNGKGKVHHRGRHAGKGKRPEHRGYRADEHTPAREHRGSRPAAGNGSALANVAFLASPQQHGRPQHLGEPRHGRSGGHAGGSHYGAGRASRSPLHRAEGRADRGKGYSFHAGGKAHRAR
ncbi:MAG: DEAD/DEAH box helicase [Hyphomicrobiaceae bacterium]|nr:MAG: DEAD/DEAH box helicase [Hyphomicrobiaceae bacterium]